jgi:hypothetical protein
MQWFRYYSDAVDNYKLRLISYEDRWHYTAILCCKSQGLLDGKRPDFVKRAVSMKLGLRVTELDEVARRLSEVGLIEEKNLQPIGWNERQFVSDNSTPRSRKSRINKKSCNVVSTLQQRHCNVPDTDTETDTETEETNTISKSAKRPPPCPVSKVVDIYHQTLPELPKVVMLTSKRKDLISQRWKELEPESIDEGLESFGNYFRLVRGSNFLMGKAPASNGHRVFMANLEWLVNPSNFAKVVEKNYHENR